MNILPIRNLSSYCIAPIKANKINNSQKKYNNFDKNLYYHYPVVNISFHANLSNVPSRTQRFEGCLLGGAIGDAFGRLAEFRNLTRIKEKFGINGVKYIPKINGKYLISDDTQMTLFTANGLLKSFLRTGDIKNEPNYNDIYDSYLDWYTTQVTDFNKIQIKKGLLSNEDLFSRRGPGATCLTSLKEGKPGDLDKKINMSAGNGGIMRISPIALMYHNDPELSFKVAAKCTALTHGNPRAYLPAGYLSALLSNLILDKDIFQAIEETNQILKKYNDYESTLENVNKAIFLAKENISDYEAISSIGLGKTGDEALGIALFAVLRNTNDYKKAIETATNHDGDSDTTAAIAGNIFGVINGIDSIPKKWVNNVECGDLLRYYSKRLLISDSDINRLKEAFINNSKIYERRETDIL